MSTSMKALRAAGLILLLSLSFVAWGPSTASAACANGSTRWVRLGGVCCINTQKFKGQSCLFGVWHDNGAVQCSGPCAF